MTIAEYTAISLIVAILWGTVVVATTNCTDGRKTGLRAIINPKFVWNSTIPTTVVIWAFLMIVGTLIMMTM